MNRTLVALLLVSIASACSGGGIAQEKAGQPSQSTVMEKSPGLDDVELRKKVEEIASTAKGHVGVAVVVLETQEADGTRQEAVSVDVVEPWIVLLNPHDHFPMQSVYKLPIGMAVMKQVDAGKIKLDQNVRVTKDDFVSAAQHSPIRDQHPNGVELGVGELMQWMLRESDGTASDVLMRLAGGPQAVQAYLTELKISDMIILDTEKALGQDHTLQYRNSTTPEAAVALLRALHERRGLSKESQEFLMKLLTASTPGTKRLKGLLPAGTIVAHKTGTSGTENGVAPATNDIGIITMPNGQHLAIAVFVSDSPADEATREGVIAKVAKAAWDKWAER